MAATTSTASTSVDRLPGERLVRAGAVIGGLGALAALIVLAQLVFPDLKLPPIMWFVAIGGVGVGVGLACSASRSAAPGGHRRSQGTSTGR
jgi:hypothetical protein